MTVTAAAGGATETANALATAAREASKYPEHLDKILDHFFGQLGKTTVAFAEMLSKIRPAAEDIGSLGKYFFGTVGAIEKYQMVIERVTKSHEKTAEAIAWISALQGRTPYNREELTSAYARIATQGIDPRNGALEALGNASSALGLDLNTSIQAFGAALAGNYTLLSKMFGIGTEKVGNNLTIHYMTADGNQHTVNAVENNKLDVAQTLVNVLNNKYGNSMSDQSHTFMGMLGSLEGRWQSFMLSVTGADKPNDKTSFMSGLKKQVEDLLVAIDQSVSSGRLGQIAQRINAFLSNIFGNINLSATFERLLKWLESLDFDKIANGFKVVWEKIEWGVSKIGGWDNAFILLGLAMTGLLGPIVKVGVEVAKLALSLIPSFESMIKYPMQTLMLAGVVLAVALGALLYSYSDSILNWISSVWHSFTGRLKSLWDAVKTLWTSFVDEMLSPAWSGLVTAGENMMNALWKGMKAVWAQIRLWAVDIVEWLAKNLAIGLEAVGLVAEGTSQRISNAAQTMRALIQSKTYVDIGISGVPDGARVSTAASSTGQTQTTLDTGQSPWPLHAPSASASSASSGPGVNSSGSSSASGANYRPSALAAGIAAYGRGED